jgi:flavin reductase (DIM6/NTAB) family NADH-FMN oxidoreductase RutF
MLARVCHIPRQGMHTLGTAALEDCVSADFVDVRILDNFYQTSSFFPMPVVLVSTLDESGQTNLGPYSLCFPYIVAGKHSMMLGTRADSNTSLNLQRTGVCAISFVSDNRRVMEACVRLGFPGDTTAEKMAENPFSLVPSTRTKAEREPGVEYPDLVSEAVQVFECTWDPSHPLKLDPDSPECHFVLSIDKIVMKKKWRDSLLGGRNFPKLPIDYGFRDNSAFWFTRHSRPYKVGIPKDKGVTTDAVKYAVQRIEPDIPWQEDAYGRLVKVPRVFLSRVIRQVLEEAKEEGVTEITPEFLDKVRDKRSGERR